MTNSIPPVLVERADTRPIRLVPLRATRAWATFTATSSGIAGVLAGGWFVYGVVILNG